MSNSSSSSLPRRLVATGLASAGAYAGLAAARWVYRTNRPSPLSLPSPVELEARPLETPDGRAQFYVRPGASPPIVLLHSVNAAASSIEMKPLADHLVAETQRSIYAMDWLGFGRSDRPDLAYSPTLYQRQLYYFLTEAVETPADVIALSLGSEYAARVTLSAAPLVRRLVLLSPTGLSATRGRSLPARLGLAAAGRSGLFELLYHRLIRRDSLRSFYERQVFLDPDAVPEGLLEYAVETTRVCGAHHAPLKFLDGSLFTPQVAHTVYERHYRPTLAITPESPERTIQSFELLPDLLGKNSDFIDHVQLPGGLMPQWETPAPLFDAIDSFLGGD